jgi:sugar phosphate isomerase/epimerase
MPAALPVGLASREGMPDLSTLNQSLDDMADLGLGHVELPAYAFDLVLAGRLMADRVTELEAVCRNRPHGFTVHGPLATNFMGPKAHLPRHLEVTKAFVEISARIGAPHLVVHAGMLLPHEAGDFENAAARQREWLHRAGDFAHSHGVVLCIENLFDFSGYVATPSIARLAREIAAIDHPAVAATFDFSHGLIHASQQGYDFLTEALELTPHARHLHLHDSFGVPDLPWIYNNAEANAFGMGDLHLPLGWGAVPWDALAEQARFPAGAIAIHELNFRFWRDRHTALDAARAFTARLMTV